MTGRAKRAVERAAGLRGNAQRAAARLRDVHGLDGLARAHVEQPLARAVVGLLALQHGRKRERGQLAELLAQRRTQVCHRIEIGLMPLVQPAHDLPRPIGLLVEVLEELDEARPRHAEQAQQAFVLRGQRYRVRGQSSASLKKNAISLAAVAGPSEPCTTFSSIEAAKSARIVPGAACFGFVAPMMSRFALMALSPSRT